MMLRQLALALLAAGLTGSSVTNAALSLYPQTVKLEGKPTVAETATVRSILAGTFGTEWSDYEKKAGHQITFTVGHADLNGDGRPDLLVYLSDYGFGYCGSAGCAGYAILATPQGYAAKAIDLATFGGTILVLRAVHKGMHDLRYDDSHVIFRWDGSQYRAEISGNATRIHNGSVPDRI
jgi:hypothetical protein